MGKIMTSWFGSVLLLAACVFMFAFASAGMKVRIEEYDVPTPDSRPHDPAVAPDGSLWYTGQQSNTVGRLDPKTGKIREFRLSTPDSGPHGLVADKEGYIWFTANYKGYVGKLSPSTGDIVEYRMPDPAAKDPHSLAFDQSGILWLTFEASNFIGRLDPRTGAVRLIPSPTSHSQPYGIVVTSQGIPFYCEFGSNKLASIDPNTMVITEHRLPDGARPRRLTLAAGDKIYYTDYARGYVARFDPATGKVEEWASPGGPASKPYGIATRPDGMVWYSESGVTPNTIVKFEPSIPAFSRRPIPSGGGVVRNMVSTPEGDLYIACSGVNKVGIVRVPSCW
ncbi:MAG: lyase [Syntrophorhabdales bacterium]|jgi:virginiamycin B lyase